MLNPNYATVQEGLRTCPVWPGKGPNGVLLTLLTKYTLRLYTSYANWLYHVYNMMEMFKSRPRGHGPYHTYAVPGFGADEYLTAIYM